MWLLPVAFAGVCSLAVAAYVTRAPGQPPGATTEVMAMLAFLFGALTALDYLLPAATFAVATTLLLSVKAPLHRLAESIQEGELYAILKFGVVSVIVLPLLPDRTFGPFQVLNPRLIWWMVVLISAISMLGYVLMRFLGARQGIVVTGILGGLASSTAAAFGLAEKAREESGSLARYFALGIVIASTIMFFRVEFLALVVYLELARSMALPLALPTLAGVGMSVFLMARKSAEGEARLDLKNPMELGRAIKFGLIFGMVLFAARAAHHYFGSAGVYLASALAGLTDVDAITISAARLARDGVLASPTAVASILLACAVNTLVKGGVAAFFGGPALRRVVVPLFVALFLVTLVSCAWAAKL